MALKQTATVDLLHMLISRDARSWEPRWTVYSDSRDEDMLRDTIDELAKRIDNKGRSPETSDPLKSDEDRDQVIDFRDGLLVKGALATLSMLDQKLFRDCDLALGVLRCEPAMREAARIRILRVIRARAPKDEVEK